MINIHLKDIPPSKSLWNRCLILKSFEPAVNLYRESEFLSEDSRRLEVCLDELAQGKSDFDVGAGAAPLKFLALRLSRKEGFFTIRGTPRLFSRPLKDLVDMLKQLGCRELELGFDHLRFHSSGRWPEAVSLSVSSSSQILSALLLSSWELEKTCRVHFHDVRAASTNYIEMSFGIVREAGWQGEFSGSGTQGTLLLPKGQKIIPRDFHIEPDMSCVAALALAGALRVGIRFWNLPANSLQGDAIVFDILLTMGVRVLRSPSAEAPGLENIRVEASKSFRGLEVSLLGTPDLFPVLAAFCSFAETPSQLSGLQNLNSKESRRLDEMLNLLTQLGIECKASGDSMRIFPCETLSVPTVTFDTNEDHRLAMAAALLKLRGAPLQIKNPEVVAKSFPNFWELYAALAPE